MSILRYSIRSNQQPPAWTVSQRGFLDSEHLYSPHRYVNSQLFNHWLATDSVPSQWKTAVITTELESYIFSSVVITPIAKVPHHTKPSDFRLISVTPVLSRSFEKYIVRQALSQSSTELDFEDQFAFRPTGSTTAAIITLLYAVRSILTSDDYVHVFSFDFSKAFDTVRYETLMNKMTTLEIHDNIYNRINYDRTICHLAS